MSTALETRYRSLLRILPATYRAEWEDEMVATFLAASAPPGADGPDGPDGPEDSEDSEEADLRAEFGRPGWSEVVSVVGLAVRLRLPGAGYSGRPVLLGDAVRLVALIGLLVSGASGAVGTVAHLWLVGKLPGFTPPDLSHKMADEIPGSSLLMIESGSHTAPIERPELVSTAVRDLLQRIDQKEGASAQSGCPIPVEPDEIAR